MSETQPLSRKEIAARVGGDPLLSIFASPLTLRASKKKDDLAEHVKRFAEGLAKFKRVSTIQFTTSGEKSVRHWHIVACAEPRVVEGAYDRPNLEIIAPVDVLLRLLSGRISPLESFIAGKLRVRGDIGLASRAVRALQAQ